MIRSVSLLRIRKDWILPAVTRKRFNTYISCLTTLLIFKAIFEPEAWIKRSILSVSYIGVVKSQYNYNGDLHCPSSQGQNCYATKSSPARLAKLYFSNTYFIWRLVSTSLVRLKPVRVKGGMSLRNSMWHGLRNDIILRNVSMQNVSKK